MTRPPEKKSESLEVRLPHSRKEAFMQACEENGVTASHAIRTFIDEYLKRSRRMKLKRIAQEISMTLIQNPLKTTGGIGALVTGGFALSLMIATPVAADSNAQPISLPMPVYPIELAEAGISASCDATFNVDAEGFVEADVEVDCTHPGFVDAVRNAVLTLRFEPKMEDGKAVRRTGVVYPMSFEIE